MRHRTAALTAVVLAAALAVPAAGKQPKVDPVVPDETGCRDVVSGVPEYQQLVSSITQEEFAPGSAALGMYQARQVAVLDKGVVTAKVELAAPSCTDVEYTIEAYDVASSQLLASRTRAGDGITGSKVNPLMIEAVVAGYTNRKIELRVLTRSGDVVHDVAPDAEKPAADTMANVDGLPPTETPASSSFR